jgi:hypothetical protein
LKRPINVNYVIIAILQVQKISNSPTLVGMVVRKQSKKRRRIFIENLFVYVWHKFYIIPYNV